MASRTHEHGDVQNNSQHTKTDRGGKMTRARKLALSAQLWGMEAMCDFEHLYTVPILQTLGMPLRLVSLTGLVAGLSAIVLLPVTGWIVDKGSNPLRRKRISIMFATSLLFLGILCVLLANLLHVKYLLEYHQSQVDFGHSSTAVWNVTSVGGPTSSAYSTGGIESTMNASVHVVPMHGIDAVTTDTTYQNATESGVPFKAGLGMMGFILADIAYDASNSFVKSFILSFCPKSEQTSLLVVGLLMASSGGVSTAALGVVDFASLLGLDYIEGVGLVIQTSIQGLVVLIFIAIGITITLTAASRERKRQEDQEHMTDSSTDIDSQACGGGTSMPGTERRNFIAETFENSIRSCGAAGIDFDRSVALLPDTLVTSSEKTPLLSDTDVRHEKDKPASNSGNEYGIISPNTPNEELKTNCFLKIGSEENEKTCQKEGKSTSLFRYKRKLIFLCISTYFSTGVVLMYTMTSSDFVGKAMLGGDPEALPGSDALKRYQQGMRLAAWGFLVYYTSYLLFSTVHQRVLAFLGYKLEFVLLQLGMAACLLLLILTVRQEAYFLLTVMAGLHRACFYVVPYAVVTEIVNARDTHSDGRRSNLGFAMSLVTVSMPLSYCTLFPWVGPLEQFTGVVATPLCLGLTFGCLSAFSFLFIGKA